MPRKKKDKGYIRQLERITEALGNVIIVYNGTVNLSPVPRVPLFLGQESSKANGARTMPIAEWEKQDAMAQKMYEGIRNSTDDVAKIAKNTGISEQRIQRIKEHVFYNEHNLEYGVGRLPPDYEMAEAWNRLKFGKFNQNDMELLNHEILKTKFEGIFKTDQLKAHRATEKSGRMWDPDK